MNRKIGVFVYMVSIVGVLSGLTTLFLDNDTFFSIRHIFAPIWLDVFDFRIFYIGNLNVLNLVLNVLILYGSMQFSKTNGKESRMTSYCYNDQ